MIGFLNGLARRVERRAMREMENAATRRIKQVLFGEKSQKIQLEPLVEYRRLELRLKDTLGTKDAAEPNQWNGYWNPARKKTTVGRTRRLVELYGKMLPGERPASHQALVSQLEGLVA